MECTLLQRRGNAAPPLWQQSGLQRGPFGDLAVAACPCSVVPCERKTQRRWAWHPQSVKQAHVTVYSVVTHDPSAVVTVCTECPPGDTTIPAGFVGVFFVLTSSLLPHQRSLGVNNGRETLVMNSISQPLVKTMNENKEVGALLKAYQ
jgi:hypothetical protein